MDVGAPHVEYRSYRSAELGRVGVRHDVGAVYGSLRLETFFGVPTAQQPRQHEKRQQPQYPEDRCRAASCAFCRSQQQHHREEQDEKQEHCFSESEYRPLRHRVLTFPGCSVPSRRDSHVQRARSHTSLKWTEPPRTSGAVSSDARQYTCHAAARATLQHRSRPEPGMSKT